ncbi:MAG: hypothetical protein GTO22_21005, partial [Gemmatimonadales bacterium]|nr:hypothetical protein [Gemmatimonadales bacterium]
LMRSGDKDGAASALRRADQLLAQAESLDPHWIEPIVLRGWLAWQMGILLSETPGESDAARVREGLVHAERAANIDPKNAKVLELRGTLNYNLFRQLSDSATQPGLLESAREDLQAAVAVDASLASAWSSLSKLLHWQGEFAEAKRAAVRAYEADEFLEDAQAILFRLANISLELEDSQDAVKWAAEGRRRFPDVVDFPAVELGALTSHGPQPDVEKAWGLLKEIRSLMPPQRAEYFVPLATVQVAAVLARAGLRDSARAVIAQARTGASAAVIAFLAYDEAHAWVLLGERDRALEALTLHLENEPQDKAYIAEDPWFRELSDDPRFKAL